MTTEKKGFARKEELQEPVYTTAIEALMKGGGAREAAKAAGISTKVLNDWLKRDGFKKLLRERLDAVNLIVEANMAQAVVEALAETRKLMKVTKIAQPVLLAKTMAIKIVLEHHRWLGDRAGAEKAAGGGLLGAGVVVKVQAMTPEEVAAAREAQRVLHERGGGVDDAA